jgi:hypothetical protein
MNFTKVWKSLSKRSRFLLALMFFVLTALVLVRQLWDFGSDFYAYFRATKLWLADKDPYKYFRAMNFKYAPSSLLLFAPLQLFPYKVARIVYVALHWASVVTIPVLTWKILKFDTKHARSLKKDAFVWALFLGFLGSLRFIDDEYRLSQISFPILWGILMGHYTALRAWPKKLWLSRFGTFVAAFFAIIKIHSLLVFAAFFKIRKVKSWLPIALVASLPIFLPLLGYWLNWRDQMLISTPDIKFGANHQGFFAFSEMILNWGRSSARTFFLIGPIVVFMGWWLPRFTLTEARDRSFSFLLTTFSWMFLGIMSSPLPWRYTYSVTWIFFAVSWMLGSAREKKIVTAVCFILAFTPSAIVTKKISRVLEGNQLVFLLMLIELGVLLVQARRYSQLKSA